MDSSFTDRMRGILDSIQSGEFHKEWQAETEGGYAALNKMRDSQSQSPLNKLTEEMLAIINKKNEKK